MPALVHRVAFFLDDNHLACKGLDARIVTSSATEPDETQMRRTHYRRRILLRVRFVK